MRVAILLVSLSALGACTSSRATDATAAATTTSSPAEPREYVYREVGGRSLHAHVFDPPGHAPSKQAGAILLFHGGGWSAGAPEWTFDSARRFAGMGLVAIAIEYRLSQGDVTPIEAVDDACAAFRWTREHAQDLGVSERVAGYGVSAGGHLVACAAYSCADVGPSAMLLWSPALDMARDGWFVKLLRGRSGPSDYCPIDHVSAMTPPACIVQGEVDTLTPLTGAQRFEQLSVAAGNACELHVYPGVGHLLTRNVKNQESDFDPDPQAKADGIERMRAFLARQGFIAAP